MTLTTAEHVDLEYMADEVIEVCDLPTGTSGTIYSALRDAFRMGREGLTFVALQAKQAEEKPDPMSDDIQF